MHTQSVYLKFCSVHSSWVKQFLSKKNLYAILARLRPGSSNVNDNETKWKGNEVKWKEVKQSFNLNLFYTEAKQTYSFWNFERSKRSKQRLFQNFERSKRNDEFLLWLCERTNQSEQCLLQNYERLKVN
jgi:hypothetical protein